MKLKIVMLAAGILSLVVAKASTDPSPNKGKKDDLNGTVQSENGKPLKDVNVTAYLVSRREKAVQTTDTGTYAFDELKPGVYTLVFEKPGFKKITKDKVIIKNDEGFQLNVEMIKESEFELRLSPIHFADF